MSSKHKWNELNYDIIIRICVALTNVHVMRFESIEWYNQYLNGLLQIGEHKKKKASFDAAKLSLQKKDATELTIRDGFTNV